MRLDGVFLVLMKKVQDRLGIGVGVKGMGYGPLVGLDRPLGPLVD
mgnify:CR=1 FL=1